MDFCRFKCTKNTFGATLGCLGSLEFQLKKVLLEQFVDLMEYGFLAKGFRYIFLDFLDHKFGSNGSKN